jgi:hypothetical protein
MHPAPKRIFVSSAFTSGNLGGLAGADATCQNLATAAGLSGTYMAWLSDGTTSAASRLTHASVPYALVDGTIVAGDFASLVSGNLTAPIQRTEAGTLITGGFGVWTDTEANGNASVSGNACANWTDGTSAASAVFGIEGQTTPGWSANDTISCDNFLLLYCVEQ